MIEETPTKSEKPVLQFLEEATRLAAGGDAEGTVRAVLESGYPNRLMAGRLAERYSRVSREVRAEAVAEGIASLHEAVSKGTPVSRPAGYVLKVAEVICADEQLRQERELTTDRLTDHDLLNARAPWADSEDAVVRARRRSAALRLARGMLPRLGQQKAQEVMAYLFDAIEGGAVDVPSKEIAEALEMSDDVVRQSLSRAFKRLTRLAAAQGLDVQAVDLLDDPDLDPDESEVAHD